MAVSFQWPASDVNIFDSENPLIQEVYNANVKQFIRQTWQMCPQVISVMESNLVEHYMYAPSVIRNQPNGIRLNLYNAALPFYDTPAVNRIFTDLRRLITGACSLNISFGFLRNCRDESAFTYKYPSNNTMILTNHRTVINLQADLETLREDLDPQRVFEKLETLFVLSYTVQIVDIFQVSVSVWQTRVPVGCINYQLPPFNATFALNNVWQFSEMIGVDNLCFWRCLAAHFTGKTRRLETMVKKLWRKARQAGLVERNPLNPVDIGFHLAAIERLFKVNIMCYDLEGNLYPFAYETHQYETTAHILLHQNHCMYIKKLHDFYRYYFCSRCRKKYSTVRHRARHAKICRGVDGESKIKFSGGIEQPELTLFDTLAALGIDVPHDLRYSQYFVAWDVESLLVPPDPHIFQRRNIGFIVEQHVPCSVALAYSGDTEHVANPTWLLSDGDPDKLVKQFVEQLSLLHRKHAIIQKQRYGALLRQVRVKLDALERKINEEQDADTGDGDEKVSKNRRIARNRRRQPIIALRNKLWNFVFKLPVIGYNSSSYDINVFKSWLFRHLVYDGNEEILYVPRMSKLKKRKKKNEKIKKSTVPTLRQACAEKISILKKRSRYLCIETPKLRFIDAYLFVAAGTRLKDFIASYPEPGRDMNKLEFPYRYLTSLEVLQDRQLPSVKHWILNDRLFRAENDQNRRERHLQEAQERLTSAQQYWNDHDLQTFGEYLQAYNMADVRPFIKAFEKFASFFRHEGIDVFQHITLPSVAKALGLKSSPPGRYFQLFGEHDVEEYSRIRNNLFGGVSMVWSRYAEKNKTLIRPHEESNPHTVQSIMGLDMTGCYLKASSEEHMTGPYFVRNETNGFRITKHIKEMHATLAVEWEAFKLYGDAGVTHLQHKWQGGEKRFISASLTHYKVDGFIKLDDGRTAIIEFNGCYFHNHNCSYCRGKCVKSYDAVFQHNRLCALKQLVSQVHIIWGMRVAQRTKYCRLSS